MFDKFKPLGKRVLIKCATTEDTTTSSGIIIRNQDEPLYQTGSVVAYGYDVSSLKVNDTVRFLPHNIIAFEDDHVMMHEDNILGICVCENLS